MNSLLEIGILILTVLLLVPAAYLLLLAATALIRREGRTKSLDEAAGTKRSRVAVVIPAHNEELLLPATLESIRRADRSRVDVEVFVIADNCEDATADLARRAGASVAERRDTVSGRGKPFALRWFFDTFRGDLQDRDLIALIDADTLVDENFFSAIVEGMADPEVIVAQGYYGASNLESSWRAALSEVALAVSHHLRSLGRNGIGSTAGLKGNGMVFRADFLLEMGWTSESLVEDLEQSLHLLERGICVKYLPNAIVRGEMASHAEAAEAQRKRWEGGRMALLRTHVPRLLRRIPSSRGVAAADALLDLVTPPLVGYAALLAASGIGGFLFGFLGAALTLWIGCLILAAITIQALRMRGAQRSCWLALGKLPLYASWKLGFYLRQLLTRGRGSARREVGEKAAWIRTARDGESNQTGSVSPSSWNGLVDPFSRIHALRRSRFWRTQMRLTAPTKRVIDLIGSAAALVVLSPLFLATAVLIWCEDRGPVFFKQIRVGRNGRPFLMWKFRSMYTDAEARKQALLAQNQHVGGVTFKMKDDPRITRIGRFIRKYSIDELPQFFNVLRGEMALIGPRPPVPAEVAEYRSFELRRLRVKPGLSCLWQIAGRAEIDFSGQVKLDLEYIHTAHLVNDFLILLRTVPAVLAGRGAY